MRIIIIFSVVLVFFCSNWSCSTLKSASTKGIAMWVTRGDQSALLQQSPESVTFGKSTNPALPNIVIDETARFQTMDGFGFNLTHGSAYVLHQLPAPKRAALLAEIFGNNEQSIGVSYIRIGIGASDLSPIVFSYDDTPNSEPDITLQSFTIYQDESYYIPVIKEILAIRPDLHILATPWSAPVWMKTNESTIGGSLNPDYYDAYARYFVKYLQALSAKGITIEAVTCQNEPQNPHNNPSMLMTAPQQAEFIGKHLGPAFKKAGLKTKILAFDHNCDDPDYPKTVFEQAGAFVDGAAFHLYGGDINVVGKLHDQFPAKNMYFTEQYTDIKGQFGGDLAWHTRNLSIGATRNWCKNVLEWNLANDSGFGPYTPGGCNSCKGALTVFGTEITRNVSYYVIAHSAKFVPSGSVRIGSTDSKNLPNVAYLRPDGKKVLLIMNDNDTDQAFTLSDRSRVATTTLPAHSVATLVW